MMKSGLGKILLKFLHALTMSFLLLNFDQKYKFSNKNNMVSAWSWICHIPCVKSFLLYHRITYLKLLVELFSGILALLPPFAAAAEAMISGCCTILIRLSNLKSLSVKTELRRITGLESMPENKWQVRYFKESISWSILLDLFIFITKGNTS